MGAGKGTTWYQGHCPTPGQMEKKNKEVTRQGIKRKATETGGKKNKCETQT